jgi:hypothetical protein
MIGCCCAASRTWNEHEKWKLIAGNVSAAPAGMAVCTPDLLRGEVPITKRNKKSNHRKRE